MIVELVKVDIDVVTAVITTTFLNLNSYLAL